MAENYLKLEGKWLQTKAENIEKVLEAQGWCYYIIGNIFNQLIN